MIISLIDYKKKKAVEAQHSFRLGWKIAHSILALGLYNLPVRVEKRRRDATKKDANW